MRDLVAQIFLDISLDLLFIERFDLRRINFVLAQKVAMTLIKLPERSIRPLPIDPERGREFQAVGQGIIPRCPNRAVNTDSDAPRPTGSDGAQDLAACGRGEEARREVVRPGERSG